MVPAGALGDEGSGDRVSVADDDAWRPLTPNHTGIVLT